MKFTLLIAAFAFFLSLPVHADDVFIVDAHRNIPLSDDEPVYKDFYLNGGAEAGFKRNLVVTAIRRSNIKDSTGAHSYGEIEIPVGQLRILAVFGKVSVAREYKLLSRDEYPMLEQTGLMAGDRIDLKGAFTDDKPLKRKTAEAETPAVPVAAETAAAPAPGPAQAPAPVAPPAPAAPATAAAPVADERKAASVVTVTPPAPAAPPSSTPVASAEPAAAAP